MGGLNVKNTIVEQVLRVIAPHPCCGCGKLGTVLCDDCKYDIIYEPFAGCILCGRPQSDGICNEHNSPIERAFTVSQRSGVLEDVINKFKFQHVKAAASPLADLFNEHLPILPAGVCIVPIPTVRSHIRQRGYDQVELMVQRLAAVRGLPVLRILQRATRTTQHTVGRVERKQQALEAFTFDAAQAVRGKIVLLIDDIVTTGATLEAAAKVLSDAGARIWVATLAYQPLD